MGILDILRATGRGIGRLPRILGEPYDIRTPPFVPYDQEYGSTGTGEGPAPPPSLSGTDEEVDPTGDYRIRPRRAPRILGALGNMAQSGLDAMATPNVAMGGPVDFARGMVNARDQRRQREMEEAAMLARIATMQRQAAAIGQKDLDLQRRQSELDAKQQNWEASRAAREAEQTTKLKADTRQRQEKMMQDLLKNRLGYVTPTDKPLTPEQQARTQFFDELNQSVTAYTPEEIAEQSAAKKVTENKAVTAQKVESGEMLQMTLPNGGKVIVPASQAARMVGGPIIKQIDKYGGKETWYKQNPTTGELEEVKQFAITTPPKGQAKDDKPARVSIDEKKAHLDYLARKRMQSVYTWMVEMAQKHPDRFGRFDKPMTELQLAYNEKSVPEDVKTLYNKAKDIADQVLRLRSGASINEAEYKRILDFVTNLAKQPGDFIAAVSNMMDDNVGAMARLQAIYGFDPAEDTGDFDPKRWARGEFGGTSAAPASAQAPITKGKTPKGIRTPTGNVIPMNQFKPGAFEKYSKMPGFTVVYD